MNKKLTFIMTIFFVFATTLAYADTTTSNSDAVGVGMGGEAAVTYTDNSVVEAPDLSEARGYTSPGDINYPGMPGYMGERTTSHRLMTLPELLRYNKVWSVEQAENMLKGHTGLKLVRIRDLYKLNGIKHTDIITCGLKAPEDIRKVTHLATGTVVANGSVATSADILAKVIVEASKRGANYIHFVAEGGNIKVKAFGWGIGLSYTAASLAGPDNNQSSVGAGGTGISGGSAGYDTLPWMQFHLLIVE